MIKNKLIAVLALLVVSVSAISQYAIRDNRTQETKIADLLAQMPATDQSYLNTLMTAMADLGEDGLVRLAGMLTPLGKGNDAGVRFALGGFSKFVTGPGQEINRLLCQKAFCKALDAANEPEVKSFLITQLQQVGDDQSVPFLAKYLSDDLVSDPAARALVTINTPEAGQALLKALDNAQGASQISVVEALGNLGYPDALERITPLASSPDNNMKKVALYALATIGSPGSAALMSNAARNSGFTFEPARATSSYLTWIGKLAENGNKALAEKHCITLIKKCTLENQESTRSAALTILVLSSGEKSSPYLFGALSSNNRQYWMTALDLSLALKGEKLTRTWMKKAGSLAGQPKADVVSMLGKRGDPVAMLFVRESLKDKDETVRVAAIPAFVKLRGESALPELLGIMKNENNAEIAAVKAILLSLKGDQHFPAIIQSFSEMPAGAKIALIEVLAARKIDTALPLVYRETRSLDAGVRLAALNSLTDLVSENDLEELYPLLSQVKSSDEVSAVQSAIVAAVKELPKEKQTTVVISAIKKSDNKARKPFYGVLARIGSVQALKTVVNDFTNEGEDEMKNAAFEALVNWTDPNAIHELYNIGVKPGNTAYREPALKACIKLIDRSEYPDDQKLLLLRKIMDLAVNADERRLVLEEVGKCNTYLALMYVTKYLDDPPLKQAAEEAIRKLREVMPLEPGFVPLFNGKDLTGWKGLVENPLIRSTMKPAELLKAQVAADEIMRNEWKVEDGILVFTGKAYQNLCTVKQYGDFEMIVDWKITEEGDAGIYLRGSPQVQIWDTSRRDAGAQVGSGGLYNNQVHERNPLKAADNAIGEWNTFRILMTGERVTVYLNGELVVDNVILENYWDRSIPIFPVEQIELQAHGTLVGYRDIYIREIPNPEPYKVSEQEKADGYAELFDGITLFNFTGNTKDYIVEDGCIAVYPKYGGKGNLYTKAEFGDFSFRFEFQLTPGANNGIGIRTPMEGDAAYAGMEIQVLDNTAPVYRNLKDYQYHGSVYGVIPAKREYLKPVGEWNEEEIVIQGTHIRVILNGTVIVDGDIAEASLNGTVDHNEHPGLKNTSGHIGFLGHGSVVKFRNLRIKELSRQ